jgi:CheY-like chemotaxis protein
MDSPMARIFVVDEDAGLRSLVREILTSAGHEVEVVANGMLALWYSTGAVPDVVICGARLDRKESLETIRQFAALTPRPGILGIGDRFAAADEAIIMAAGANAVLPQPLNRLDLLQWVATFPDMRRQRFVLTG